MQTFQFLKEKITDGTAAWVGGVLEGGVWKWLDGTPFSYESWKWKEPSGRGPHFGLATGNNNWIDWPSDEVESFVCQYDAK